MKSLISTIAILGLVGMVVGVAVQAATEGSVTATVTVQSISLTVTDGTVAYGVLVVNTSTSTLGLTPVDTQTATNNGNVTENFNIRGTNSANWTLQAAAGNEQYVHKFSTNGGASYTPLTLVNQTLATGKAPLGTQSFDLQITTPTATTFFTQQSVNVTVQAIQ